MKRTPKRPNRERECLVGERTRIVNRMKGTLARLGIRNFKPTLRKAASVLLCHGNGRQIAGTAHIGDGIARMSDGGDNEAGIGEGLGGVVIADEVAAPTVRDDNKRQLVARDRRTNSVRAR